MADSAAQEKIILQLLYFYDTENERKKNDLPQKKHQQVSHLTEVDCFALKKRN